MGWLILLKCWRRGITRFMWIGLWANVRRFLFSACWILRSRLICRGRIWGML